MRILLLLSPYLNSIHVRIRCKSCGYFCTLPLGELQRYVNKPYDFSFKWYTIGHTQQEHETSHGSMSGARWQIIGHSMEVGGRQFASNDDGAPMMVTFLAVPQLTRILIILSSVPWSAALWDAIYMLPLVSQKMHVHAVEASCNMFPILSLATMGVL